MSNIFNELDMRFNRVLELNTFWFFNPEFEERYDAENLGVLRTLLLNLRSEVQENGYNITKSMMHDILSQSNGLRAILALNGLSNEQLKRIVTLARVLRDSSLDNLLLRQAWSKQETVDDNSGLGEWGTETIEKLVLEDDSFREGIINLFFKGAANPILSKTMKPFELKKLSIEKLTFKTEAMIDTLVRYKEHGSYSAQKRNNAEEAVREILSELGAEWFEGDLSILSELAFDTKRKMDFVIPNKENPLIIAESSYLATTASGQGDKSKTEISVRQLLQEHYPNAKFIGFVDGIGWYVRKRDLKRMIAAYDDVFTFHEDELMRFRKLVIEELEL